MSPKTGSRLKKFGLIAFSLVVLFTLSGFFILPPVLKSLALDKLSATLHRPVSIGNISINPYKLTLKVDGLNIGEREGEQTFVGFESLFVNLDVSSLAKRAVVVSEIRLEKPKFRVVRVDDNHYNFSDLVEAFAALPKSEDDSPGVQFSLNNLQISGGTVELEDRLMRSQHTLSDIQLTLPFISNMAFAIESFVEPAFSARIDDTQLQLKGRSKPFADSLESEVELALNDLQLTRYTDYLPRDLPFRLKSGAVDTDLKLTFRQEKNKGPSLLLAGTVGVRDISLQDKAGAAQMAFKKLDLTLSAADLFARRFAGTVLLHDLSLKEKGDAAQMVLKKLDLSLSAADLVARRFAGTASLHDLSLKEKAGVALLAFKKLDLAQFSADLNARRFELERLALNGSETDARIGRDGELNWLKLLPQEKPDAAPAKAKEGAKEKALPPLTWKLGELAVTDAKLRFADESRPEPVKLELAELALTLRQLESSGTQPTALEARFRLGKKGEFKLSGTATQKPLKADLNLDLKALELLPFQSYFADYLNIAVTRGQLTLRGDAKVQQDEKATELNADTLAASFTGQVTLGNFQSVDKLNSADFLHWRSFFVDKIDFQLKPLSLRIGEIALSDFFARVILSQEGKLNLGQIVRKAETAAPVAMPPPPSGTAPETPAAPAAAPVAAENPLPPIQIGKVTLQGGSVRFTDNFIKPNYTANLQKIGGRIDGLSSEAGTTARLELRGSYDDAAPLNIEARINPLSAKPYLDLQADVKGIEMTSFSPYSGKYAGYAIDKGKLSLFVNYKIENDQLQADNRLFLDQLTFGERIESPDATSLPVNLALALLKNRQGEIDINLPISGSLSDPQFSVGGLVVKVIVNLLVKAVTSPFALIGSLFGSGEELSNVEFDFGMAAITVAAEKRLENLAKALVDRPGLKLEITPHVDAENDPEGIRRQRLELKVRAVKREDLTRKGVESGSVNTITVSPEEYPTLLERAYKAEKFPKPRNAIGLLKTLPVEEMEKLMLTHSPVSDDDLRELATERAKAVRDWLIGREVPTDRVFLVPAKAGEKREKSDTEKKLKESRVDFSLK